MRLWRDEESPGMEWGFGLGVFVGRESRELIAKAVLGSEPYHLPSSESLEKYGIKICVTDVEELKKMAQRRETGEVDAQASFLLYSQRDYFEEMEIKPDACSNRSFFPARNFIDGITKKIDEMEDTLVKLGIGLTNPTEFCVEGTHACGDAIIWGFVKNQIDDVLNEAGIRED